MAKQKVSGIFGVTSLEFDRRIDEFPRVRLELAVTERFNPNQLYEYKDWDDMFPGNAIVKCQFCGQWGARKCACTHCGGAIE